MSENKNGKSADNERTTRLTPEPHARIPEGCIDFGLIKRSRDMGFNKFLGIKVEKIDYGHVIASLELAPRLANPIGSVHGGVIFSICDMCAGYAAATRGRIATTLNAQIHYLRPAMKSKKLIAESFELKTGKNICVYSIEISDDTGELIAMATITGSYIKVTTDEVIARSKKLLQDN